MPRTDGQAAVAVAGLEELLVFAQFILTHHIVNFDAAGGRRTDKQFVPFRRELDALADAAGVEMIKQSCRFRGDIKHRNAVLVLAETCAHRHLAIRMKGEALNPVTHVFDHAGDRGYFQRQIDNRYVTKLGAEWHGTLTNQRQFPVQADAKNIRYIKQLRIDSRFYFHLTQVTHLVVDKRIPMDA